nr:MAG TPA: hypothetical protein [Caudoviricetes sp.]
MAEEKKEEKIALPFNFRVNQCRNYLRLAVNTADHGRRKKGRKDRVTF